MLLTPVVTTVMVARTESLPPLPSACAAVTSPIAIVAATPILVSRLRCLRVDVISKFKDNPQVREFFVRGLSKSSYDIETATAQQCKQS